MWLLQALPGTGMNILMNKNHQLQLDQRGSLPKLPITRCNLLLVKGTIIQIMIDHEGRRKIHLARDIEKNNERCSSMSLLPTGQYVFKKCSL